MIVVEHVIDAAQRGGVVVYTIHAKGLVNSTFVDPGGNRPFDGGGRLDIEGLIGPQTVNTMPEETIRAFDPESQRSLDKVEALDAGVHAIGKKIVEEAARHGLLLLKSGIYSNCIRVLTPLVLTDAELDEALAVWEEALDEVL